MATSNYPTPYNQGGSGRGDATGTGSGNFFFSRKNVVGMALASVVIGAHVVFGLGVLWPVAAAAAWGAGVALTPPGQQRQKAIAPPASSAMPTNKILRQDMKAVLRDLRRARPPKTVVSQADELEANLEFVLEEWDDLQSSPEHQQTIWNIIKIYLPEVVVTYINAPQFQDLEAAAVMQDSLSTLTGAVGRIKQGILDHNLRAMDSQARTLRETFGNLPGLDQQ